jgi:hypothetical protein
MKASTMVGLLVVALGPLSLVHASQVGPIEKVLEMISELQSKIIGEGETAQKLYEEFSEWCEEQSKNLMFEIKTGKQEVQDLKAVIVEEGALIETSTAKVEDLSAEIASDEADLKAATDIREKEGADFAAEEKEGMEIISTLQRAIKIISKGGASMLQLQGTKNVAQALKAMVQAEVLNSADSERLTALVQQESDDDDDEPGAPAGEVYESHSGGIIATLEDLLSKAEAQLDDARKKEQSSLYNFELLKQSLTDQIKTGTKNLDKAKKSIAESSEKKATAEGDLDVTTKDLKSDTTTLNDVHHDCMTKASDFEAETTSRGEELKAIAEAKKIIIEATGGALNQVSLLQLTGTSTNFQVVRFVRDLARKQHSPVLAQLSKRMATAIRFGSRSGADPFEKVKGLIADMIAKLEEEGEADATHHAYCEKEMGETKVKSEDKTAEVEKLTTAIDDMTAQSAKLKEEVATLQKELSDLASSQAEMDKLRSEEHDAFVSNKAELDKGLDGIKLALKVLRDYYGKADKSHAAAEGAGGGIIDLLEVCESDFEKELAAATQEEETAASEYETTTKANEIEKASKDQDVKYKTAEATDLDKTVAETQSDLEGVQSELAAINEYWAKLKDECIEKAEPYAERAKRRAAEIAGLKEALDILSGEAVLLQQGSTRRTLRGVRRHTSVA